MNPTGKPPSITITCKRGGRMNPKVIHYSENRNLGGGDDETKTLCGKVSFQYTGVNTSGNWEEVNCKLCLKKREKPKTKNIICGAGMCPYIPCPECPFCVHVDEEMKGDKSC